MVLSRTPGTIFLYSGYLQTAHPGRNLGYIKHNPYSLFLPQEIQAGNKFFKKIIPEGCPGYVPQTKLDYHAQLQVVAKGLKAAQDALEDMEFRPPRLQGSYRHYKFMVPIAFFMGDTPAHDKLCCIKMPKMWIGFVANVMFQGHIWTIQSSSTDCGILHC